MKNSDKISDHFWWRDVVFSETAARHGLNNAPPDELLPNIRRMGTALESIRYILGGRPIFVSSWYRCPRLNKLIGGSSNSKHMEGLAVDFVCPAFGSPLDVAMELEQSNLDYDQLIHEYGRWIHVGLNSGSRRESLTAIFDKDHGKGIYLPGLHEIAEATT
jgi:hypothetical protein